MICTRCGAAYEGNFCPRCGTPAGVPPAPPAPAFQGACPRCGTVYQGNFCPRCGLPAGAGRYGPAPIIRPKGEGIRSALSILWMLALVGFFLLIALNFSGLLLSPGYVVPGIQGIASGQNANQDLAAGSANWSFQALGTPGATETYSATGGNPDGYLQMTLPAGANVGGEWVQAVQLAGSAPWAAEVQLDHQLQASAAVTGRIAVSLESTPSGLDLSQAAVVWVNATTGWTTTPRLDVSGSINDSGTYYLKVAFLATSATGAQVGFDNVRLRWVTDAYFYFYLPLPTPQLISLLYISRDKPQFLAYYAFIVIAIIVSAAWYTWRDRKLTTQAFTAPLDAIGTRLRSMSGWVAIAQAWLAMTFFQELVILLLGLFGTPATSPFPQTATNGWVLLFDFSAASVFEEIAFRMFLIGLPMAVGSFILRLARSRRGDSSGTLRKNLGGAFRYLLGGQLRRESPREAILVAGVLVLASSTLFGLAHAPGYGWWKVLPAFVAGLGMAYVFVRHGLGASILVHFATDGAFALILEGVGGFATDLVIGLLFLGLAIAGAGFFAWYIIYGWEEFTDLFRRFGGHVVRQPVSAGPGPGLPPPGWSYPPGNVSVPYPTQPATPSPPSGNPPPGSYTPPTPGWQPPPPIVAAPRNPNQLPHGYAPTYRPAPYGYPPVRFQCPYCGWVEAKYENRHFTCLRCGRAT